ncbi:PTS sugar transporter subunit IIA [Nocardia fluminea]|uniref:PTS system N-acetylglucosamine-specific IIA component (Glc family) n=1 Tax=Nocardia fluminea TaxID=134984 RepID=A0A2N3V4D7_9NOCA|nr:PTS glucose transporter subunit IIA [Nocardia fluminea]PKV76482.1 PTS system N-acetylglucosamine-specific IIA component (Glc family) [Nocardia fluminea]
MSIPVLAPLPGKVVALSEVPDQVFAEQIVGSGIALDPDRTRGPLTVTAPIAGKILKLHPHAFVILGQGVGVLVHLGIDTVKLKGEGFELLATEGDTVEAGTPIVTFDPTNTAATGYSVICPVVVMDSPKDSIATDTIGTTVEPGSLLFDSP